MGCGSAKPYPNGDGIGSPPAKKILIEDSGGPLFERKSSLIFENPSTRSWYRHKLIAAEKERGTVRSEAAKVIPLDLEQRRLLIDVWESRIADKIEFCSKCFQRIFDKLPTLLPFFADINDSRGDPKAFFDAVRKHGENFSRFLEVIFAGLSKSGGEKAVFLISDYIGRAHVGHLKAVRLTREYWLIFANSILEITKDYMEGMQVKMYIKAVEAWNILLQFLVSLVRTAYIGALESKKRHCD